MSKNVQMRTSLLDLVQMHILRICYALKFHVKRLGLKMFGSY